LFVFIFLEKNEFVNNLTRGLSNKNIEFKAKCTDNPGLTT